MKRIFGLLTLMLMILVGCNGGGGEGGAIGDSFVTDPDASGSVVNGACFEDQYATPEEYITRKLDIAIVIDTSGSIVEERAAIADGFDYFLGQLPAEVDFQVAVILGHGDNSAHVGKLYQKGSEPVVLKSSELTIEQIKTHLRTKMQNPAGDNETDGGELGQYSLEKALGANLADNQAAGFFRSDAALAVVFVADEQDICAKYPEGVVPVLDVNYKEPAATAKYCQDAEGNFTVTPQTTLDAIAAVQGNNPYVTGGVIYINNETMPVGGENEIGYGYKETVELNGGILVDMANGDYSNGLANLGIMAITSIKPANDFNLKTSKVDEATIEVLVNGQAVPFTYSPELNQVNLTNDRDAFSVANLKYCEKPELPKEVQQIVAGGFHTCALMIDGNVKCWGRNNMGQLGYGHMNSVGDDESLESIDPISLGGVAVELSAGIQHTCALLDDGSVKCWGDNSRGQLGLGNTDLIGDNEVPSDISAIDFGVSNKVKHIYSGTKYNCALFDNKKIKCWGENTRGQLGLGHINHIGDDEAVSSVGYVSVGSNVIQMDISTISQHTCAVLESGDLKCWGFNSKGQLGYGHTNNLGDDEVPSAIPVVPFGASILQVATGSNHTCAVADGQSFRCWGNNNNGQIGLGINDIIGDDEAADSAAYLNTGSNGTQLAVTGNNHTCTVSTDNDVYCFGLNSKGQLGLGHTNKIGDDESINGVSQVNLGVAVSQVTAGTNHTCALTKDEGKVICWGQNNYGQLGYGNTNDMGDNEDPSGYVAGLNPSP
jgi:hypothetical protein